MASAMDGQARQECIALQIGLDAWIEHYAAGFAGVRGIVTYDPVLVTITEAGVKPDGEDIEGRGRPTPDAAVEALLDAIRAAVPADPEMYLLVRQVPTIEHDPSAPPETEWRGYARLGRFASGYAPGRTWKNAA